MKQSNKKKSRLINRSLASLTITACAIATSGLLGSCAYTETMDERNAEGQALQKQLGHEVQRNKQLTR